MSMATGEKVTLRLSHNGQIISQRRMTADTARALLDSLRSPGWVGEIIADSGPRMMLDPLVRDK